MIELKRCPFCGDEVEIRPTGLYHWRYAIHHKTKTECILDTTGMVVPRERDEAIRLWNERSADRLQGEWINDTRYSGWTCTHCNYHDGNRTDNYCPHCGARMFAKDTNVPNKKGTDDDDQ